MPKRKIFEHDGKVLRVIDGDTVDVVFDLGMRILTQQRCRLFGIDAPEPRGDTREAGRAATRYLDELVAQYGRRLLCRTFPDQDKYGRYIVELLGEDEDGEPRSLNEEMVRAGHAIVYDG